MPHQACLRQEKRSLRAIVRGKKLISSRRCEETGCGEVVRSLMRVRQFGLETEIGIFRDTTDELDVVA